MEGVDYDFPIAWRRFIKIDTFNDLLCDVIKKVNDEYLTKKIFPLKKDIFKALQLTSPNDIKVVIIGQDPYHGEGQACGLAFSVNDGIKYPPSLKNIFKEVSDDMKVDIPKTGNLQHWAKQGVLLLNSTLTVQEGKPTSHKNIGWERITQNIIDSIALQRENIVYILWGSYAQKIGKGIDRENNLVIEEVHPSPLSSYRGFFGSKPFSRANEYLKNKNCNIIKW